MGTKQRHCALLSILTIASVFFFHSKYLVNWDAGQFALGTVNYSLADHTPHPPGYYLFVQAGKLLTLATHDVNSSFIALATLAALGALLFFYKAVHIGAGHATTALIASIFLFLNPIFWFNRSVALTYTFEALAVSLSLWATAEVLVKKNTRAVLVSFPSIAILAGFRPSVILASLPLLALQAWHARRDKIALALGILLGALCLLLWLVPFAWQTGGISSVLSEIANQAKTVRANPVLFFEASLIAFNALLLLPLFAWGAIRSALRASVVRAAIASAFFSAFFFLFFHFGETGYILALLPPLFFVLAFAIQSLVSSRKGKLALLCIATLQVVLATVPLDWIADRKLRENLSAISEHDGRIDAFLSAVRSSPTDTVVVVLRGQYYDQEKNVRSYPSEDIRLFSYYLPDYTLIDFPGVRGRYAAAHQFRTREYASSIVRISSSAKELLVRADYLHPDVYPRGIAFSKPPTGPAAANIYRADISKSDTFTFLGFSFVREQK